MPTSPPAGCPTASAPAEMRNRAQNAMPKARMARKDQKQEGRPRSTPSARSIVEPVNGRSRKPAVYALSVKGLKKLRRRNWHLTPPPTTC